MSRRSEVPRIYIAEALQFGCSRSESFAPFATARVRTAQILVLFSPNRSAQARSSAAAVTKSVTKLIRIDLNAKISMPPSTFEPSAES